MRAASDVEDIIDMIGNYREVLSGRDTPSLASLPSYPVEAIEPLVVAS